MSPEADLLKEVPLFQLLDDHERTELVAHLEVVHFASGETVFNYGEPGHAIYVISSGEVEVFFKNDTGERIVLDIATRGDFSGELSMLDRGTRSTSVMATQETETLRLDHSDLDKFLRLRPQAAMDYTRGHMWTWQEELRRSSGCRLTRPKRWQTEQWIVLSAGTWRRM